MYLKTTANGVDYPYSIQQLYGDNPDVSFPSSMPDEQLADWDMYPVTVDDEPVYDPSTQKVQQAAEPVLVDGAWVLTKTVVALTTEEVQDHNDVEAALARAQRNTLLAESDWVSIKAFDAGSVLDAEWSVYRQGLRDIPSQEGFPTNVIWPQKPNSQSEP
jgi:hypothetical protein